MPSLRRTALIIVALSFAMLSPSASAKPGTRVRSEIPAEYRWDFTPIFADWDAWEAGLKELETKMDAFAALKGTLSEGPAAVLQAYQAFDDIGMLQFRVFRYPQLQRDVDMRDQAVAARLQRAQALFAKFRTAIAKSSRSRAPRWSNG